MENLQVITQQEINGKKFTIYGTREEPLFLAKDIAAWIGHSNVTDMVSRVDPDEVAKFNLGGLQGECNFLTEDGLYEVLMQSRKPIAKEFKKEVKRIMKSIRQHGLYAKDELLDNPKLLLEVVTKLHEERKEKLALQEEKEVLEIALNESLEYFTVAKFNNVHKMKWNLEVCKQIGKELSAYCRVRGFQVRKCHTNDERFGTVNSYPLRVWKDFLHMG